MADYIEREAAVKRLLEMAETAGKNRLYYEQECMETAAEVISGFPAADVAQVKHGEWDKKPFLIGTSYYCSECGDNFGEPYNYCPNCGAKMDEEAVK